MDFDPDDDENGEEGASGNDKSASFQIAQNLIDLSLKIWERFGPNHVSDVLQSHALCFCTAEEFWEYDKEECAGHFQMYKDSDLDLQDIDPLALKEFYSDFMEISTQIEPDWSYNEDGWGETLLTVNQFMIDMGIHEPELYYQQAQVLNHQGDLDGAIERYEEIHKMIVENEYYKEDEYLYIYGNTCVALAEAHKECQNYEMMEGYAYEVYDTLPTLDEPRALLIYAYMAQGKYSHAKSHVDYFLEGKGQDTITEFAHDLMYDGFISQGAYLIKYAADAYPNLYESNLEAAQTLLEFYVDEAPRNDNEIRTKIGLTKTLKGAASLFEKALEISEEANVPDIASAIGLSRVRVAQKDYLAAFDSAAKASSALIENPQDIAFFSAQVKFVSNSDNNEYLETENARGRSVFDSSEVNKFSAVPYMSPN